MKAAFCGFSVSIESQTNCPACFVRALSVKTNALIERHVCHQGAQASTKIGSFLDFASENARAASSSTQGRDELGAGAESAEAAAAARNTGTDRFQRIHESYDEIGGTVSSDGDRLPDRGGPRA